MPSSPPPESKQNETNELVRTVYAIPADRSPAGGEVDLATLVYVVWSDKWIIAGLTILGFVASVIVALLLTNWYRADALLAPSEMDSGAANISSRLGALGSIAGLAGLDMDDGRSVEAVAILQSRDFAREFIQRNNLLHVLLADEWDEAAGRWKAKDDEEAPDIRDAIKFFDEEVRSVSKDPESGLITLSVTWTDPDEAASWVSTMIQQVNDQMRNNALEESQRNIAFLEQQLRDTNIAVLDESLGAILEGELQELMLAKGNDEYAFRVLDRAQVPKRPDRPKRLLIVVVGTVLAGLVAILFVVLRYSVRMSDAPQPR